MNRLVLIDGKSVFYRGYYAMGALSLPDGTPTGGVYGFAAISMEIVKKIDPTKIVVAWDSKTSTSKRKALYQDYKAGRIKPGEDFYAQIPLLKELIKDLGWSFVELNDYEADDIIGTLSRQADETLGKNGVCDWETYIISSDLDMLQIVDKNTHMWRILKGFSNIEKIDIKEIEEKYGIKKSQFLDLKALKGDSSDNIPGVPGIGEKTAAKLLNNYGTLDGIYDNLDKITGSTKAKLEEGKASAYLSRKLAEIMFNAPINLADIPDFVFDENNIVTGLKKLQFNSLIRRNFTSTGDESGGGSPPSRSEVERVSYKPLNEKGLIIDWDIKSLMHDNPKKAQEILNGTPFWDLGQAEFLLNPLSRSQSDQYDPMDLQTAYRFQARELAKIPRLYNIYTNFDLPLIPVLYKMENKGMLIDRAYFKTLKEEYEAILRNLEQKNLYSCG